MSQIIAILLLVITLITGLFWFYEKYKKKIILILHKKCQNI